MTLQEMLTNEVLNWEMVGHHALLQRFVLRQGKPYHNDGRKPLETMEQKECFRNATLYSRMHGGEYVEGYVMRPDLPILIHHAWVATSDGHAVDPTLRNNGDAQYFGVPFDRELVVHTTMRQGFYGMLDTGLGLNTKLMFGIDPGLEAIVKNVKPHPAFVKAQQEHEQS
jgi:hypothetical protein